MLTCFEHFFKLWYMKFRQTLSISLRSSRHTEWTALKKLLWKHSNIMCMSVHMYGSSTFVIVIVSISSVWIIVIVIVFINEKWSRLRRNNNPRRHHHRSSRSRVHFKHHITNQLQHRMTDRRPLTAAIVCQIGESADWDGQG